jgi:kynurenine formamidase
MKIIDLTHTFDADMPVYPGDPKSSLKQVARIEKDTYNDFKLETVMHVGTHMDAPFHMIEEGKKLDEINPEKFFGRGVLIDVRGKEKIDQAVLTDQSIEEAVVLLYTDRGSLYREADYYKKVPYLTEGFARAMVDAKVKIVGMDMLGPDLDTPWPTHKILLGSEILLLENLTNLDQLLRVKNFDVVALPPKFKTDAAPVRVVALVKD